MVKNNDSDLDIDISKLGLDKEVIDILRTNSIDKVSDLWCLNRKKLKDLGIKDADIKIISIKLQLFGLDFNKKIYR